MAKGKPYSINYRTFKNLTHFKESKIKVCETLFHPVIYNIKYNTVVILLYNILGLTIKKMKAAAQYLKKKLE